MDALRWEIGIPLVTNPRMLRTMAIVTALSVLIPTLILGMIFASQGHWDQIGSIAGIFALVGLGLFGLFLLVMLVFFGNRLQTRYTLNEEGIRQETIDKVGKAAGRVALVAGALGRSPGTAGASLIAMSQEAPSLYWRGGYSLEVHPDKYLLVFRNAWRPLLEVYCTPENYDSVEALTRQYMARHQTEARRERRSPLPRYLGHSALILLACVPLFAACEEYAIDLLLPILLLAFALATLWLIPLFGYVVLIANVLIVAALVATMLEERTSMFRPGNTYLHYEVFSADDWGLLLLTILGLGYLWWLAWQALRGGLVSLLVRDEAGRGDTP